MVFGCLWDMLIRVGTFKDRTPFGSTPGGVFLCR